MYYKSFLETRSFYIFAPNLNYEYPNNKIQPQKNILLQHTLYKKIQTIDDLHHFLENHVYAVWDFMSLLKALQSKLTCTTTPWFATSNSEIRYLINEIVFIEETDLTLDGRHQSHYEMYIEAMEECGAKTNEATHFLSEVILYKMYLLPLNKAIYTPIPKCF